MEETKLTGRGGPGRGQGRKRLPKGQAMISVMVKMRPDQKEKLTQLGGAKWMRARIDKARLLLEE